MPCGCYKEVEMSIELKSNTERACVFNSTRSCNQNHEYCLDLHEDINLWSEFYLIALPSHPDVLSSTDINL